MIETATTVPAPPHEAGAGSPKVKVHHPVRRGRRLFFFTSLAVAMAGTNAWLFADWLWRLEWTGWHTTLLVLFFILSFIASFGCLHAVYGIFILHFGDKGRITQLNEYQSRSLAGTSTAIVIPIFNEDVIRVYEGIRVMFESLKKTGHLDKFDFFILSDSTHPGKWVQEETRWFAMCRELGAFGRIHYRRRVVNREKKSGNIRDFLNAWGRRYRYMIVIDADSIMLGRTFVDLVKLMEANPPVGLIQTVPGLINNESLFGRLQQFSSRLFGPLFAAGLNYWVQDGGNYWGHNAIIRVEPFMHNCDLPTLPGKKPFGGHILSHDFVEAALLRREDWQVWLAWDLEGSWEEGPQSLVDFAQRDRRWCQGNLQHALLLFAKGLRGISRVHLLLGILGYLSSPLWLAFMLVFAWIKFTWGMTGLSELPVAPATPFLKGLTMAEHGLLVFAISMGIIFLPKFIALLDLALSRQRRVGFGGWCRASAGVFFETLASALHAPILMLFHTHFVLTNLLGREVGWGPQQRRAADGTAWEDAWRAHWWHTLAGVTFGVFAWHYIGDSFWWFAPVLVGLVFSIPISVLFSRKSWGDVSRWLGLFRTPEETNPPPELLQLSARLAAADGGTEVSPEADDEITLAVVDPYANAIHVSLLREKKLNEIYLREIIALGAGSDEVKSLCEKLLVEGPTGLAQPEKLRIMSDSESMAWLHSRVWTLPPDRISTWWLKAIRAYGL